MPSRLGSKNVSSLEYKELFETLCMETGLHPVRVLFTLLRNRQPMIRLQAARAILPYRFAVQKTVHVDAPTQMVLGWEGDDDVDDAEAQAIADRGGDAIH